MEAGARCPWCDGKKRTLAAEVHIHHIDGDRSNSIFENLILTCRNHHGMIEDKLIPQWEVQLKKTCLSNPGTLERLGLEPLRPQPRVPRKSRIKKTVVGGNNAGIAAETINNSGTMAGTINVGKLPKAPVQVAGSLATSVDHYGYVEHLIKRLARYQSWPPRIGGPPDNPGAVRRNFQSHFGRLPKDFPLNRFGDAVDYLIERIKRTALGKAGKATVSTFEEWKQKGRPKS